MAGWQMLGPHQQSKVLIIELLILIHLIFYLKWDLTDIHIDKQLV